MRDEGHRGTAAPSTEGVDITLLHMLPSEELVYFVRRCARQLEARQPGIRCSRVIAEKIAASSGGAGYRVTICVETSMDALQMSHLDSDLYLAVRDAFETAALELDVSVRRAV